MPKIFHLKQKLALASDNYKIKLNDEEIYQVKGNGFKLGTQASFETMDGTQLAALAQTNDTKLIPWKKFVVFKGGKEWGIAKQEDWGMLDKKEISIDLPGENDYKIVGDRMSWKFEITKGDEKVGEINKKWGVLDSYGISVEDGADEVDLLLCGILIDACYHDGEGQGS